MVPLAMRVQSSAATMLLRSSSTPGLCSLALGDRSPRDLDHHGEVESPMHSSKSPCALISSSPAAAAAAVEGGDWDFERELVPWPQFRKVQSESDLGSLFSSSSSTPKKTCTTPGKQWSRRMSLIRHSSLPVSMGTSSPATGATASSILEELQAPLPGLLETDLSEEDGEDHQGGSKAFVEDTTTSAKDEQASGSGRFSKSRATQSHGSIENSSLHTAGGGGLGIGTGGGGSGNRKKHSSSGGSGERNPHYLSSADSHYQRLLECDPGQPLLLRNYARYLHEVERDFLKAEEYYGRAILAAPEDPELRSLYAKFIWDAHKDADRASCYFEEATQAAPDDCYILGAYASFMWDTEEQEAASDAAAQQTIPLVAVSA